jgi:RNA polymerase sigma-70 factor (ECF subfamily)
VTSSSARRSAGEIDEAEFVRGTEPLRRELLAHCYRMLGSVHDAEEAVQETYLRAWRSYDRFQHRSSTRVWLYRIATNACLTALQRPVRRMLPSGLGAPSEDPAAAPVMAGAGVSWIEPIPDAMVLPDAGDDPAAIVAVRASVRLALIASLQALPARQRAVLILRDVLAFPAAEVAEMLDTSTAAVKSALQRARAKLDEDAPAPEQLSEPDDRHARALLDQYMHAFEHADQAALERALRADAVLEMTPSRTWFAGKRRCMSYVSQFMASPGQYRMIATSANGQPAVGAYLRGESGDYAAFTIVVLTTTSGGIARITLFGDPGLFRRFGLPPALAPDPRSPRSGAARRYARETPPGPPA